MANSIVIKKGKIQIKYDVTTKKEKGSEMITCLIPAFDICYTALNEDDIKPKSMIMVKAFFEYWLKKLGTKQFGLEIHKLGFRASKTHSKIMKDLINGQRVNSIFENQKDIISNGNDVIAVEEELVA